MAAIFYLIICILTGYCFLAVFFGMLRGIGEKSYEKRQVGIPDFMVIIPFSGFAGAMLLSWMTYVPACILRDVPKPLTTADIIACTAALLFDIAVIYFRRKSFVHSFLSIFKNCGITEIIVIMLSALVGSLIMISAFYLKDNEYYVGMSVFGDFATHLDMIRSFAYGDNFPTQYSHFAGADLKYHFMYQFFVGNLEHLGMRLDIAFNLPSIFFFTSVCMLLYVYTVKLTERKAAGMISVILFLFRSSPAFWLFVSRAGSSFGEVYRALSENLAFIGETPNESWGLYNLNVFTNQRHFCVGLTGMLAALILLTENCFAMKERMTMIGEAGSTAAYAERNPIKPGKEVFGLGKLLDSVKRFIFDKAAWLPEHAGMAAALGVLLGLSGFFNGAVLIACLLVLFFLAFAADRRLEYLITAALAVALSSVEAAYFVSGSVTDLRWQPGYLAEQKNLPGMTFFLCMLFGIAFFIVIAYFLVADGLRRWFVISFASPVFFALCFQMTTDVNVNHKYILIGAMLSTIPIASMLCLMWGKKNVVMRLAVMLSFVLLTSTGIYDLNCLMKQNNYDMNGGFVFKRDDPVTKWVLEHADSRDLFLSDTYAINNVTMGGAMLYYGWPYFAWSAGYDTAGREAEVIAMFGADTPEELRALIKKNNIRYIIVDQSARTSQWFELNEENIKKTYECVYSTGEGEWEFDIYDTRIRCNHVIAN
ncbi:MAG: hypothetical protein K6G19_07650 [Lachnospiraceae bacterium]|nr:hypothetical protein [Lachnospiraceae bacterium]